MPLHYDLRYAITLITPMRFDYADMITPLRCCAIFADVFLYAILFSDYH